MASYILSDDTWLFILISSCVGVILLGTLLAMILMKCKKSYYPDATTIKHPSLPSDLGGNNIGRGPSCPKTTTMRGTMLYPFVPSAHYQSGLGADNRMLWATLTPHGTQHFISEPQFIPHDDHYEVIDYQNRHTMEQRKNQAIKNSFENSGFVDFDYEDPTPLIETYNTDDIDSGYQEPQNINGSYNEGSSLRAYTPTQNNPVPSNMHRNFESGSLTNKKQGTLGRRISDISTGSRSLKV